MTEKQENMLKKFTKLNGFDFDTKLQIGDMVITINELKTEDNYQITNFVISQIMKKKYKFYIDENEVRKEYEIKQMKRHNYIRNYIKQSLIKQYTDDINFYKTNDEIWIEDWKRNLTPQEKQERIERLKRILLYIESDEWDI